MNAEIIRGPNCPEVIQRTLFKMDAEILTSNPLDPQIPVKHALALCGGGIINSLAQLQLEMQLARIPVNFLAMPLFSNNEYKTIYPIEGNGKPEFTLYVVINNPHKALNILGKLYMSPDDNLRRLKTTGILQPRATLKLTHRM